MTGPNPAAERLRQRLERESEPHPPAWKPEPGDELMGTFEGWSQGTTRRDETHPIAIVHNLEGERLAVWCFYSVLREELRQANPKPGELIAIRRLPDRANSEGQPYRVFRVAVDRDQGDPFADTAPAVDVKADGDWLFAKGGER